MGLSLYSVSHHHCPLEVRERVMLDADQRRELLRQCHAVQEVKEACILQTCNRLEFYLVALEGFDQAEFLQAQLQNLRRPGRLWRRHVRALGGLEAVRHLFEVAAGLDSQLVGENQILAQVKQAYREALECHTSRLMLNRLFHMAFRVGKEVRSQTGISRGAVSLAQAAVAAARDLVVLSKAKAVLVGAGRNAELTARALVRAGVSTLIVANRDPRRAQSLCDRIGQGIASGLEDLPRLLKVADLLVSSTGSPEPVLTEQVIGPVLAARPRPLLMIDLAVPRDIDPAVASFACVTLKNLEDLGRHVTSARSSRLSEVPKARAIVDRYVDQFRQWHECLSALPVVSALAERAMATAKTHAGRYANRFCDKDRQALVDFAQSLAKKLMDRPIRFLRDVGTEPSADQAAAVALIRQIFDLHD